MNSLIVGIVYCVLLLSLLYGLPLMMPRYRARANRQRLASQQFDLGAPMSDNVLGAIGVLLLIVVVNVIAWATGVWY